MKSKKSNTQKSRQRHLTRLVGLSLIVIGAIGLGIIQLIGGSTTVMLLAGIVPLVGVILVASPDALFLAIDAISWIP